jgi:hypothetical protein
MEHHEMDCMDCHNRPSHNYPTPDSGIDQALFRGEVSETLPWFKKVAVEALTTHHPDKETAHREIRAEIERFYAEKYPKLAVARRSDIEKGVEVALRIHDRSVFPKMNVDWRTYAQHIGHKYWPGCFRCHDGKHKTAEASCSPTPATGPVTPNPDEARSPPSGSSIPGPRTTGIRGR